jgi:predicted metal-dependent hydrolase
MEPISYQLIRSDRKTIAIQITHDGTVLVRAPRRASQTQIRTFVESKRDWILSHLSQITVPQPSEHLTSADLQALADRALELIPKRVAHFAPLVGVDYGRITIRNQRSRWGSCSAKGNLNFNCLLMLCPEEVLDYVVVHELCHLHEFNHSPRFWALVAAQLPDYEVWKKWLKTHTEDLYL